MAPETEVLAGLAIGYLERQTWFEQVVAGRPADRLELDVAKVLDGEVPGLASLVLAGGGRRFHVLVGWRAPGDAAQVLAGRESALLGPVSDDGVQLLSYEALADDALALRLLGEVTGGAEQAERVRRVSSLVSHASLVFDDRLFMKVYRVLEPGSRREVELMLRLDEVGFNAMLAPVAVWSEHGADLVLVREFQSGALEGRTLALTSLRDLLAHASKEEEEPQMLPGAPVAAEEPAGAAILTSSGGLLSEEAADLECASAGGDLAAEMRRLGTMTAALHAAIVVAFGETDGEPGDIAALVAGGLSGTEAAVSEPVSGLSPGANPTARIELDRRRCELGREIATLTPELVGRSILVHGDYHLRRVMRSDAGWLVAGFGDDPLIGESASSRSGSPVEDLADMCYSIGQIAEEALSTRPTAEKATASALAAAWARRNVKAFLEGYRGAPNAGRLLPPEEPVLELLLEGLALERAGRRPQEATVALS